MHFTWWKFSTLWKFSLHIVYIFKKVWNFLAKFWYSDQVFYSNIFKPLYLKAETSAHAQLAIPVLYILFSNILTWYLSLENLHFGDTPWKMRSHHGCDTWLSWNFFRWMQLLNRNVEQAIKMTFGRKKFGKGSVKNLKTRIYF